MQRQQLLHSQSERRQVLIILQVRLHKANRLDPKMVERGLPLFTLPEQVILDHLVVFKSDVNLEELHLLPDREKVLRIQLLSYQLEVCLQLDHWD